MSKVEPVVYKIYVNERLITEFPLDVELRMAWGQHDLFLVRIEYYRGLNLKNLSLWPDNAPIRIVWGMSPSSLQTWYGYVNHHTVDSSADSGSKAMQISYTCIGTSKPMNSDKTKTWGEVTITYIAKQVAAEYGLRCVVSSSTWVLPSEVQANESDFHFMNRMANKVGYRFWVSGGTLYCIDPSVAIQGGVTQTVPTYYMDKSFYYLDTLRSFSMATGDNLPGAAQTTRTIYGVNSQTGQPFQVIANTPGTKTSGITQVNSEWPVTSISEAQNLVNALQGRSQYWQVATAEVYGTSVLYPGKLIQLVGNQLNTEATGYWLVGSADHVMKASGTTNPSLDKYVTRLELLRNTALPAINLKNVTKIVPEFNDMSLSNGVWRGKRQVVFYDNYPTAYKPTNPPPKFGGGAGGSTPSGSSSFIDGGTSSITPSSVIDGGTSSTVASGSYDGGYS